MRLPFVSRARYERDLAIAERWIADLQAGERILRERAADERRTHADELEAERRRHDKLIATALQMMREGFAGQAVLVAPPAGWPAGALGPSKKLPVPVEEALDILELKGRARLQQEELAWRMLERELDPKDVARTILRGDERDGSTFEAEEVGA